MNTEVNSPDNRATTRVFAIPCGRKNGEAITRSYTYDLVRDPEPFGATAGRATSRLWGKCPASARHGLDRVAPLAVVWTDSIEVTA